MTLIYCITHLESGRYYIGKTENTLAERWAGHRYGRGCRQTHMAHALNKHGASAFSIEEIARIEDPEEGNNLERLWIILTRSYDYHIGYNMTMGGDGGDTRQGKPHTEETKEKIRKAHVGRVHSPEHVLAISLGRMGLKDSPETRQKKSLARMGEKNPNFGKKRSPETQERIRKSKTAGAASRLALGLVPKRDQNGRFIK